MSITRIQNIPGIPAVQKRVANLCADKNEPSNIQDFQNDTL